MIVVLEKWSNVPLGEVQVELYQGRRFFVRWLTSPAMRILSLSQNLLWSYAEDPRDSNDIVPGIIEFAHEW